MNKIVLAGAIGMLTANLAFAGGGDVRNPFLRKLDEATPAQLGGERSIIPQQMPDNAATVIEPTRTEPGERDPLLMYGVRDFFVVGVLSAPHDQVAVLRTQGKDRMFVRVGDRLGVEKYVIKAIDVGGVSLAKEKSVLRLPVRNPAMEDIYDADIR